MGSYGDGEISEPDFEGRRIVDRVDKEDETISATISGYNVSKEMEVNKYVVCSRILKENVPGDGTPSI